MIKIQSPTRVTFALDIIGRIEGGPLRGYHELGIVKHQVALADTLSIEAFDGGHDTVECGDPRVPRDGGNICVKVCELVRREFFSLVGKLREGNLVRPAAVAQNGREGIGPDKSPGGVSGGSSNKFPDVRPGGFVRIVIDKKIPVRGGMAGGSANAAATLRALDRLWGLNLTQGQFVSLGRSIGMDVPFFFTGGTAFDSEAGGVITPVATALKFHIILAVPEFGVSTKDAYKSVDYGRIGKNVLSTDKLISALKNNDRQTAMTCFHNDFEISIFEQYPRLKEIKDSLLKEGCLTACMSGSGSTVIGIAADGPQATKIASRINCQTIITETEA